MCIMQVVSNANNEERIRLAFEDNGKTGKNNCKKMLFENLTKTLLIVHGRILFMPHYFLHLHIKRKSALHCCLTLSIYNMFAGDIKMFSGIF